MSRDHSDLNVLTGTVLAAAIRIHSALGPGLFESVYETILARDLVRAGLHVEVQKSVSFEFEGMRFEKGFRADMVIEGAIVVEIKSVQTIAPIHEKQLLTYLKLLDARIGLLLNFGAALMKDGIRRIVNNY